MKHAALILSIAMCSACAFDFEPCVDDQDCPEGTTCMRPPRTGAPVCIAPDEVDDPDLGVADQGAPPDGDDVGVVPDVPDPPSNHMSGDDCPEVRDCGEREPNDTEDDAIYLSRFAEGCSGFGLEEWSTIHQDSLCEADVDQFILEYVACDNGAFRLTVSLTTPETCTLGADLSIAEGLYDCDDANVRCEILDGVQRITLIIDEHPDPQPVQKIRFAVTPGLADSGVDYILRATIGR